MIYAIDFEFIENECRLDMVSVGIAAGDGRTYYAISNDFGSSKACPWVQDNVLSQLESEEEVPRKSKAGIAKEILEFVAEDKNPVFVGFFCGYDYVLFSQLFGGMESYPPNFPQFFYDVKQMREERGIKYLPEQDKKSRHNSLADALHIKRMYYYILRDK